MTTEGIEELNKSASSKQSSGQTTVYYKESLV